MVELAEVFRRHGPAYRAQYGARMLPSHQRAMRDIERCRTPALGGHIYTCPHCDQTEYVYHSCRNRHCPKCQHGKAQAWLDQQRDWLLPVPYFMLTCTLPAALRPIARRHQRLIYDLLFRTSAAAIQQLGQAERWVGGQMGMMGVLHTWGRNLAYHPHVHYLVPGGGVGPAGTWRSARANFLLPVKALSQVLRAKFRDALRQADAAVFAQVPAAVWQQDWVVHPQDTACCQPMGTGVNAVKYLASYVFRVAISNRRIIKLDQDQVTFRYRDTKTSRLKTCTLPAQEFIRRSLRVQHVLPKSFVKVRYYGFLAVSQRQRLVALREQ
ncbi:MAG: transposase, partial [Chloroflexi bacterium]|nr:transposase [Chloroflexota bacterium]